ncbi:MAG: 4Fe-4S dicluster domain-containing protein [Anaerolineae bacterium]|nr:4Fe-4S dicluster domain-containing protein [Anaerolineae bacterium]MCX8066754.1 4Fe-4S dicluster domain-containing protein [Anaerolineae bacterium]MDW7990656.1 4Fe-4S dicluster domain-containing protein [Anaerolineae bacterium]
MRFTTLDRLKAWLDRLAQEVDLVAPCDVDGHVLYRPVSSSEEVLLDYERPELPAKDYLFPATEVLLRIEQRGKDVALEEVLPDRRQVLFGIRPCDAHGLAAIDALFLHQAPPDRYYQHHRERTTLVGMACIRMWEGCFCTSMGGGPTDATYLDVLIRPGPEGFFLQPVTPRGVAVLEGLEVTEPKGEPLPVEEYNPPVPVTPTAKWRAMFEGNIWMRHGERCLSCRICTYVCPTCRCFDVADRVVDIRSGVTRIERIRAWDACTSPNYRRVAGGHNPRPTNWERLRNRFLCKFCYYPEDFGPLGCVGCGRCIVSCPVDIDITEVMRDVAQK